MVKSRGFRRNLPSVFRSWDVESDRKCPRMWKLTENFFGILISTRLVAVASPPLIIKCQGVLRYYVVNCR